MAVTKLSLYNGALQLIGERELSSDTEDVASRHSLDTAYDDPAAISYCLELTKPKFALLTAKLSAPSTPANHALAYQYAFPSDYISLHTVFADSELDDTIERYIVEGRTIACDVATNIWLRYVTDSVAMTSWTPTFTNVVEAYLAKQIAPRWAPQKLTALEELFVSRVEVAVDLEGLKEGVPRPHKSTATLNDDWRKIYNDALFILGLDHIVSNNDDSERRAKLDVILGTGVVETVLEDLGWTFGITSQKITYDPSLEPDWGHSRVYAKPSDMHRLDGIFYDQYFRTPIKDYEDEGDYWYCGVDEIYVKYVKTGFLTTPSSWPQYFANLIGAELACRAAPALAKDMIVHANEVKQRREAEAGSTDAMTGPPQAIKSGSWVRNRTSNRRSGSYNGRP